MTPATPKTKHVLAARTRERRIKRTTALLTACQCEWPLKTYRNVHGHGKTIDGQPCPAIGVWEAQRAEAEEALELAGAG